MQIIDFINHRFGQARISGVNAQVACPFHDDHYPGHLYINITNGLWHCFHDTCLQGGNYYSLIKRLNMPLQWLVDVEYEKPQVSFDKQEILPESILASYLSNYPTQLLEAGFTKKVLELKEVGYDLENYRITFPIRNKQGTLVGVAGRETLEPFEGRYKFYNSEFSSIIPGYQFNKSKHLYNLDLVYPSVYFGKGAEWVIIVEGFKACIWLLQCGIDNVVALMGASISNHQLEELSKLTNRFILFLDHNKEGNRGIDLVAERLMKKGMVYLLPAFKDQPDQYSIEEIGALIKNKYLYTKTWRKRNV